MAAGEASAPPSGRRELYPEIEPYNTGMLKVSEIHTIYYEESGDKDGPPIVFVHGGPGGGTDAKVRRFFNPRYRIILFDQRGCGKSTPYASLEENDTWSLVEDMERIREHLGIEKWVVFGGSWGSTLSLGYAVTHPERVKALVLRGIFLLREKELKWYYEEAGGAEFIFPDAWDEYVSIIPEEERGDLIGAYHRRLTSDDEPTKLAAAKAWSVWEGSTSKLLPNKDFTAHYDDPSFALPFARIENHFFKNLGWGVGERVFANIDKIRDIPAVIVQGRYDVVCPMRTAWDLHKAWPEAEFHVIADAGHNANEPGVQSALLDATDKFIDL